MLYRKRIVEVTPSVSFAIYHVRDFHTGQLLHDLSYGIRVLTLVFWCFCLQRYYLCYGLSATTIGRNKSYLSKFCLQCQYFKLRQIGGSMSVNLENSQNLKLQILFLEIDKQVLLLHSLHKTYFVYFFLALNCLYVMYLRDCRFQKLAIQFYGHYDR